MPYTYPISYTPIDRKGLFDLLADYEGTNQNRLLPDFESAVSSACQVPYAVALNSGTAAIHLGLKALGVGRGDEVLVSTFTYVGSVNPILYLDARPVFIDSEPVGWNMDTELLEHAIIDRLANGTKPKVILVVHTYGMPADMDRINSIARRYGISVLEDAAEALGTTYHGRPAGGLGSLGVISFNTNKTITTYGGGVLLTEDRAVAEQVNFWASQSREDYSHYEHLQVGYSYRMGLLNAAAGILQMKELDYRIMQRRKHFEVYASLLNHAGGSGQGESSGMVSNRWMPAFVFDHVEARDRVRLRLEAAGIESRYLWKPMHLQPVFGGGITYRNGISEDFFNRGLCLPTGNNLIVDQVLNILSR